MIPPGQEPLLLEMLRLPATSPCSLRGVEVARARVVASYQCGDDAGVSRIELVHPSDAVDSAPHTTHFALRTPAGAAASHALLAEVAARVRTLESPFRWEAPQDTAPPGVDDGEPLPPDREALGAARFEAYSRGLELFRARRFREAFELYRSMAQQDPHGGVLAMLVATLAASQSRADNARHRADADRHAEDPLRNFIAGVGTQLAGHQLAESLEDKARMYRLALRYLERSRAYAFEPRYEASRAVCLFRLGETQRARESIEQAARGRPQDPDVLYARAEIEHRTEPQRAIADLEQYLATNGTIGADAPNARDGGRRGRARRAIEALRAIVRGDRVSTDELFDPVMHHRARRANLLASPERYAMGVGIVTLAASILSALAAFVGRRRTIVRSA